MSERKVINKWLDPEFDATRIVVERTNQRTSCGIRMMLPMTVTCLNCGNYMYIGTKFNMRIERVLDEDYLGILVYRFYFKCSRCYAEVTFKTDPRNHDYVCEWGLKRKAQLWKDMALAEEEYKETKSKEMKEDAMKSLEYKKYDTKIEMDIMDAIDQVKTINRRLGILNIDDIALDKLNNSKNQEPIEKTKESYIENDNEEKFDDELIRKKLNEAKCKRLEDDLEDDNILRNNLRDKDQNKLNEIGRYTRITDIQRKSYNLCNEKIMNICFKNKQITKEKNAYNTSNGKGEDDSDSNSSNSDSNKKNFEDYKDRSRNNSGDSKSSNSNSENKEMSFTNLMNPSLNAKKEQNKLIPTKISLLENFKLRDTKQKQQRNNLHKEEPINQTKNFCKNTEIDKQKMKLLNNDINKGNFAIPFQAKKLK